MNTANHFIRGLAEVSIRVHDFATMRRFYAEVIGLEILREFDDSLGKYVFFSIGAGDAGSVQNIALFEEKMVGGPSMVGSVLSAKSPQIEPKLTTLHHIAFSVALEDLEAARIQLENRGVEIRQTGRSKWMPAQMFYFVDPEGNVIEFKSHDPPS
jgi:catechol 2,3-dioxygenase-like lactoylglutathione lyase family enzyme